MTLGIPGNGVKGGMGLVRGSGVDGGSGGTAGSGVSGPPVAPRTYATACPA